MVTGDVHTWLWCDVPYHRGWWRALSTSIHDCDAVLRGTYVYHMENLLMTHCHWWQTGLHQRQKNLSKHTHTLTHTNTPHTHSLTFPYIYRRFFEQRRHYCHRYLFRVLCGQCYCYQFHYSLRFLHDLRSRKVAIQLTSSHQCWTLHLQPRWPGSIGGRPERAH